MIRFLQAKFRAHPRILLLCAVVCVAWTAHAMYPSTSGRWDDKFIVSSAAAAASHRADIAVIGDSLVSGYGLRKDLAYPAQLQQLLQDHNYNVSVTNYGRSGDTTQGGVRRLDNIPVEKYHLIMIVLGGNDMLRGEVAVGTSQTNLDNIIRRIRERNPDAAIILGGMKAHPGHPSQYRRNFENIYHMLSRKHNIALYPFILDGVYGKANMMMQDTIHPNDQGVAEMARRTAPLVARALNALFIERPTQTSNAAN